MKQTLASASRRRPSHRTVSRAGLISLLLVSLHLGADQDPALLYEEALALFNAGDTNAARIHVKQALQGDPAQIAAQILLGKIYLKEGDGELAEKQIVIAERLGANRRLTAIPLAQAYLIQHQYERLLNNILPTFDDPELDSDILGLRGKAQVELGRFDDALASFSSALEYTPNRAAPMVNKAIVMLRMGRVQAAEAEIISALNADPENAGAWMVKGAVAEANADPDAAMADYDRVLRIDPDHLDARLAKLSLLLERNDIESAHPLADALAAQFPNHVRVLYLSAQTLRQRGDESAARELLTKAANQISRVPEDVLRRHKPSLLLAGLVYSDLEQWEKAYKTLQSYVSENPEDERARKMLGSIMLSQGQARKAIDTLEPALEPGSRDYALLTLLGRAHAMSGHHLHAADLFEQAIRIDPDNPEAITQRALNSLALGEIDTAVKNLRQVHRRMPGSAEIGTRLAAALIRQEDFEAAVEVAEQLVEHHPNQPDYISLLAAAQIHAGMKEAARTNLEQILVMDPNHLPAQINLGRLEYRGGQAAEAQKRFLDLLDKHQDNVELSIELARTELVLGQNADAIARLQAVLTRLPSQNDALPLLIDQLIRTEQPRKAMTVARKAEALAPEDAVILQALARAHLALNENEHAQRVLRRVSSKVGADARRLFAIALLQRQAEDTAGAVWSLHKAIENRPDFLNARLMLAKLLVEQDQTDAAEQAAETIIAMFPQSPAGALLSGNLALLREDYDTALGRYREAADKGAGLRAAVNIVRVYEAQGQYEKALGELIRLQAAHADDADLSLMLANAHTRQRQWDRARAAYAHVLSLNPGNPLALNNLAYIHHLQGSPLAEQYAYKALEAAPQSGPANDTLGWILVQNGKLGEGLKYLRNASALEPTNPEIRYHLAVALHKTGRNEQARIELAKALQAASNAPWKGDAQTLDKKLEDG